MKATMWFGAAREKCEKTSKEERSKRGKNVEEPGLCSCGCWKRDENRLLGGAYLHKRTSQSIITSLSGSGTATTVVRKKLQGTG